MRLRCLAVGRMKRGPEQDLVDFYAARLEAQGRQASLNWGGIGEVEESGASTDQLRKAQEAEALTAKCGDSLVVSLDERGKHVSSIELATWLREWRDEGTSEVSFVIGGPDGLDPSFVSHSRRSIAFGSMTWPHRLVRIMLTEQLYRAATILSGHPYHRA